MIRARYRNAGLFALAGILLIAGCRAETFGEDDVVVDPTAIVIDGPLLPGGTVTLSAPGIGRLATTSILILDESVVRDLIPVPEGDGRVRFTLPEDLRGGEYALELRRNGEVVVPAFPVRIGGPATLRSIPGQFDGVSQALPQAASLIGFTTEESCGNLMVLDARGGTLRRLPGSTHCGYWGVGASYRPGGFTISLAGSHSDWRNAGLSFAGLWVDTAALWGTGGVTHELAPGIHLNASKHWSDLSGPSVGPDLYSLSHYRHTEHFAVSPNGRWAVPDHASSDSGVLIVDRSDGSSRWIRGWPSARTDILGDGSVVVFGPRTNFYHQPADRWLARIDPSTGVVLDSALIEVDEADGTMRGLGRLYALKHSAGSFWPAPSAQIGGSISTTRPHSIGSRARPFHSA